MTVSSRVPGRALRMDEFGKRAAGRAPAWSEDWPGDPEKGMINSRFRERQPALVPAAACCELRQGISLLARSRTLRDPAHERKPATMKVELVSFSA